MSAQQQARETVYPEFYRQQDHIAEMLKGIAARIRSSHCVTECSLLDDGDKGSSVWIVRVREIAT